jgi:glutaminyl-tRNA synthetase
MVLRAKIDMASPNINLRDPAIYRIKRAHHHNTGDRWCIYPMYAYAHPIEDALERITHSFCTLEFEDQRPWYDWLLERLVDLGLLSHPLPKQYEFGRLNLTSVMTSKRKLKAMVDEGIVSGWDDPRMPTLAGMRRRGYTPESIRKHGRTTPAPARPTSGSTTACSTSRCATTWKARPPRAMAVLDPLPLKLTNWAEVFGSEPTASPARRRRIRSGPELGQRRFELGPQVWIERDDFAEVPPKGFFRLFPGNKVRLKYGMVIECTGCEKDADGRVTAVLATVVPDTKSGTPGADASRSRAPSPGWRARRAAGRVRLFERLFATDQPEAGGRDFRENLNPQHSKRVVQRLVRGAVAGRPRRRHAASSSATATSSPTASTTRPAQPVFNRRKSLPPMDSSTSAGVCSCSSAGSRCKACAEVSPGTPAFSTCQPVSAASTAG